MFSLLIWKTCAVSTTAIRRGWPILQEADGRGLDARHSHPRGHWSQYAGVAYRGTGNERGVSLPALRHGLHQIVKHAARFCRRRCRLDGRLNLRRGAADYPRRLPVQRIGAIIRIVHQWSIGTSATAQSAKKHLLATLRDEFDSPYSPLAFDHTQEKKDWPSC